jgi:PAS domain S-box-containing protein
VYNSDSLQTVYYSCYYSAPGFGKVKQLLSKNLCQMMKLFWLFSILISITVSLVLIVFLLRTRAVKGKFSLLAFAIAQIIASCSFLFVSSFEFPQYIHNIHNFLIGLTYAFMLSALTALLVFFLEYTRRVNWLTPINALMLGLQPTLTLCILWLGPFEWSYKLIGDVVYPNGQWMWVVSIYGQSLALFSLLVFIRMYQGIYPVREWSRSVVIGYFCIMAAQQAGQLQIPIRDHLALYIAALSFMGIIIAYVFLYRELLVMVPISRETVVEKMPDGWAIINNQNRILDLNVVAESVVGDREVLIGQDVNTIFSNWDSVSENSSGEEDVQLRASTNGKHHKRFFNLTAIPLADLVGEKIGWLVLWRDITQRHAREQARQRAQNEMFGLLYSISAAASRTQSLENFINITMQDLMHVFKCHQGAVFLADKDSGVATSELFLAAHHGLSSLAQNKLYVISTKDPLVADVIKTREPLVIPAWKSDPRVPEMMRDVFNGSLLIVPMISDDQLIGIKCLSRDLTLTPPFTDEDVSNLFIAVEQVANYVSGDRRRQLAIVLAERQKLVRDLHDSVTQKLYGLVALTEAAKTGLEVGSIETMIQVLPRIGENARQALKEMRLFLYGLQPVNIERDGLVSVLHQRLAAVEGRADIKARFVAEDNISLPIEKQVALYFIAQEALNNVLKHAKASSVTIHLGETRSNFILEIVDDGCGASPSQLKGGGMGIKNMYYRAAQVDGKLKIDSSPGKGTRIKVTLTKDRNENSLE